MTSTDKARLRREALLRRSSVGTAERREWASSAALRGVALAGRASTASVFLPVRGEPDTLPLIAALAAAGHRTVLPVTVAPARPLRFLAWRPGDPLVRGAHGIETPAATATEHAPDLLFVPLAAFDRRGYRLGYGGGYYDRTLSSLRAGGAIVAVGLAFATQEIEAVPVESHDEKLDAVLTEDGLIPFGAL